MRPRSLPRPIGHLVQIAVAIQLMASVARPEWASASPADPPRSTPANYLAQPTWSFESDVANRQLGLNAMTAGDVNGDGFSDVVATGTAGTSTSLYLFVGGPSGPTLAPGYPVSVPTGFLNAAGDLNGDGFADIHEVSWDGTRDDGKRAAAGLYFYRLELAEKTMIQKVALLP